MFGLCLPEVKCAFYKWSIRSNVSCCYRNAAPQGDGGFMRFVLLARLRGSAPPLLPCALPAAAVPEMMDICRGCIGLRLQRRSSLGS